MQNLKENNDQFNIAEINYQQNVARRNQKKEVITEYSDASPKMARKSGEHQYCTNNVATPELPTLLLSTQQFITKLEAIVLYAQVLVLTVGCHLVSWCKITRSSSQLLWILEEALYVMKGKKDRCYSNCRKEKD